VPLFPPTGFADASFDAIYGISVMTHLTAAARDAWLEELARLLRPGGIALVTFNGAAAAAYSSVERDPAWWSRWLETGFDDSLRDPALDGKIGDDAYYRNTHQSAADVRRTWSQFFEVVDIYEAEFGYQDLAVLRRLSRAA